MKRNPALIKANSCTLNPKPLNPKTLNPKPLNPKPSTPKSLHPKPAEAVAQVDGSEDPAGSSRYALVSGIRAEGLRGLGFRCLGV